MKSVFALGFLYYEGKEVSQNGKEAAKWFRKGAKLGDYQAQYNLGVCYLHGVGVAVDKMKAVRCFMKAEAMGSPEAKEILNDLRGE